MNERALIDRLLRPLARHPAARGLADDAAVFAPAIGRDVVLTHDMMVEGVHFLPDHPPSDLAWKLLAVNLSDLAAMGARPVGVLLSLGLARDTADAWIEAFVAGLGRGLERWNTALLGGDTVRGGALVLGLTAIGEVERGRALARSGGRPGDKLWVSGTIGDAGLGLAIARGEAPPDKALLARHRRPEPRLALGQALVGIATACMDVSDGLLIDAERLAEASGCAVTINLAATPVSAEAAVRTNRDEDALLALATAGDDYELLFAAPPDADDAVRAGAATAKVPVTPVGYLNAGTGLVVIGVDGRPLAPVRLGWEH